MAWGGCIMMTIIADDDEGEEVVIDLSYSELLEARAEVEKLFREADALLLIEMQRIRSLLSA